MIGTHSRHFAQLGESDGFVPVLIEVCPGTLYLSNAGPFGAARLATAAGAIPLGLGGVGRGKEAHPRAQRPAGRTGRATIHAGRSNCIHEAAVLAPISLENG